MPERNEANGTLDSVVKIKLLIMVAAADGVWDERETKLLNTLAVKFGLPDGEVDEIRRRPKLEIEELARGLPPENARRIDLFGDLVRMAFADRNLHDEEYLLLVRLGRALGFDEDAVRTILHEKLESR